MTVRFVFDAGKMPAIRNVRSRDSKLLQFSFVGTLETNRLSPPDRDQDSRQTS
jgi:hypothetical protein